MLNASFKLYLNLCQIVPKGFGLNEILHSTTLLTEFSETDLYVSKITLIKHIRCKKGSSDKQEIDYQVKLIFSQVSCENYESMTLG